MTPLRKIALLPMPEAYGVVKGLVVVVVIEAVELEIEMGHVDVQPAVAVHVGGVDAHAGLVLAVLAGRNPGAE